MTYPVVRVGASARQVNIRVQNEYRKTSHVAWVHTRQKRPERGCPYMTGHGGHVRQITITLESSMDSEDVMLGGSHASKCFRPGEA